jgi:predicted aminopeptidase
VKKILVGLLVVLFIFCAWNYSLLYYACVQLKGQLTIIFESKPIDEVINDKSIPKETKDKLLMIAEIKKFALEELGFPNNNNYTTFYDQHNRPLMYVVSACPEFSMQEYEWHFPIAGNFTYKGFFKRDMADQEVLARKTEGLDVYLGTASGWSTLGWLKDPVLSGMLKKSKGELAELIIHELTHSYKYDKNNVTFNENLATFVGQKGAILFIKKKFGNESPLLKEYEGILHDNQLFDQRMTKGYYELDSLYKSFKNNASSEVKKRAKKEMIGHILGSIKNLDFVDQHRYDFINQKRDKINNAWFASFKRYNTLQPRFEKSLEAQGNDLKKWLQTTDFSRFSEQ